MGPFQKLVTEQTRICSSFHLLAWMDTYSNVNYGEAMSFSVVDTYQHPFQLNVSLKNSPQFVLVATKTCSRLDFLSLSNLFWKCLRYLSSTMSLSLCILSGRPWLDQWPIWVQSVIFFTCFLIDSRTRTFKTSESVFKIVPPSPIIGQLPICFSDRLASISFGSFYPL